MQLNRQSFLQQLELIQKCSSTSINEDVSDKIIFYENGVLNISRGRLVTILDGGYEFEGVFPIENLLKIVKAMSGEDIKLEMIEDDLKGRELKIISNSKLGLKPIAIEGVEKRIENALKAVADLEFKPLPKNFIQGLTSILKCTPNDKTTPALNFVAVRNGHLAATDNLRLGDFTLSKKFPSDFLIDNYNVQPIIDFNPISYVLKEDRIIFNRDNDFQICAISPSNYPDFSKIVNRKADMSIILPEELKELVFLAQQIPGKSNDRNMKIGISKNKISLECNTMSGWFRKNLRVDYSGNPITFSINLNVLADVLSGIGNEIHISNEGTGIIHNDNFNYCFPIEIEGV